jgi:hypothetical protein
MRVLEDEKRKDLNVLCHLHHEILKLAPVGFGDHSGTKVIYACPKPTCQVHYSSSQGYFLLSENGHGLVTDSVPHVRCEHDQIEMYLAEVIPEKRSFRLWKCPKCMTISAINA